MTSLHILSNEPMARPLLAAAIRKWLHLSLINLQVLALRVRRGMISLVEVRLPTGYRRGALGWPRRFLDGCRSNEVLYPDHQVAISVLHILKLFILKCAIPAIFIVPYRTLRREFARVYFFRKAKSVEDIADPPH